MKNIDYIKSMSVEEFADYIHSIYICGVLASKCKLEDEISEDYIDWLEKEHATEEL